MKLARAPASARPSGSYDGEYVYDIVMGNGRRPYFFANGIMVHNSVYFTLADKSPSDVDEAVGLADAAADRVNSSMPAAMRAAFFVPESRNTISVEREIVAHRGMFKDGKKRYALAVDDKSGFREQSMKIMGMDTKRTEIPEFIRDFLKACIEAVVRDGKQLVDVRKMVEEFRSVVASKDPWELGRLTSVSELTAGAQLRRSFEAGLIPNPRLHYAVVAADNTNRYIDYFKDGTLDRVRDGDKVLVYDIKRDSSRNPLEVASVAVPVGTRVIPQWFKDLPFDVAAAEQKLLMQKLDVTFGDIGWDLRPADTNAEDVFG